MTDSFTCSLELKIDQVPKIIQFKSGFLKITESVEQYQIHHYQQHAVKNIFNRNGGDADTEVFCIVVDDHRDGGQEAIHYQKRNQRDAIAQ